MKCLYCGGDYNPRQKNQRFCHPRCGGLYRKAGGISLQVSLDQQQKDFVKEMLGIKGNVFSFEVQKKELPTWAEVSAAIERADSEHCSTLERESAVEQENQNVQV